MYLFGAPWRHLGTLGAPLGLQFGSPGVILAPLGHHCCHLLSLLGVALDPLNTFREKGRNKNQKGQNKHRIGVPGGKDFDDILSFCRKWQTAFGLRLRGRIGVGASCFHSLGLHVGKHEKGLRRDGRGKSPGAEAAPS